VTQFLAPSISIRDRFVRAGVPEARIDHQPYGIDVGAFDRARDSPPARNAGEPLRVGFIGSLMVSKGPAILLDAAAMLSEGRVAVDVFGAHTAYHGDDSYRAQLEPKLSRAGVRWHGPLPHERLADTLATLDALVVPSIWPENSPFVALEAIEWLFRQKIQQYGFPLTRIGAHKWYAPGRKQDPSDFPDDKLQAFFRSLYDAAPVADGGPYRVTSEAGARIRQGPGTTFPVAATLPDVRSTDGATACVSARAGVIRREASCAA